MKGIILAGGKGTRLRPITDVVNKFLQPVYDKLMIEYSIDLLVKAGITDIAIVLGVKSAGETMNYLQSGAKYGAKFTYFYQDVPLGVPDAIAKTKEFIGFEQFVVLCADNVMYDDLRIHIKNFKDYNRQGYISAKTFDDTTELQKFAVLDIEDLNLKGIVEKPIDPPSRFAFCGVQIYNYTVFKYIEQLELSERGEYEITHVFNKMIEDKVFGFGMLMREWFDCGEKDSLFKAQEHAYKLNNTFGGICK